jgi:dihydroorotase
MTVNPARILRLEAGVLAEGAVADITLVDPEREEVVEPERFASQGKNTAFGGWQLKGTPVGVMVGGRWFEVRPSGKRLPGKKR